MALSRVSTRVLALCLFISGAIAAGLNVSGDAIVSKNWDCCKPSCSWKFKAEVNQPVQACGIDGNAADPDLTSGCNEGGASYQCPDQQPWAVNDTFAYGFGAAFIKSSLEDGRLEEAWCCACYQIDFQHESLRGKTMIIQATNTMYDQKDQNRFSLSVPGLNFKVTYAPDTCNTQYGLPLGSHNNTNFGVTTKDDCENVPEPLRPACRWRFDWYNNDDHNSATFKRVVCPAELTNITTCTRNDDIQLAQGATSAASNLLPLLSVILSVAGVVGLLSM